MSASGQSKGWLNSGDGDGVDETLRHSKCMTRHIKYCIISLSEAVGPNRHSNGHCDGDGDGVGCIADGDGVGCIANKRLKHWTCIITQLRYCGNKSVDLRHSNGHCGDGDVVGVSVSVGIGVSVLVGSGNETL